MLSYKESYKQYVLLDCIKIVVFVSTVVFITLQLIIMCFYNTFVCLFTCVFTVYPV